MFGWFRSRGPQPPVDLPQKLWVERQMSWLVREFGLDYLREVEVVLPTPEFFPEPFDGSEAQARPIFERVCAYMDFDAERVDLRFFSRTDPGMPLDALGLYVRGERDSILLERSLLADVPLLVATLAHEVARVSLLDEDLLTEDDPNHEYVSDLLTVFLGLGVFGANSVMRETSGWDGGWSYWSIGKHGHLSERLFGYALSVFAWARGEEAPAWAEQLRLNVRDAFTKGLDYLGKTSDTQFSAEDEPADLPVAERLARAVAALASPSSGARLSALWDIKELEDHAAATVPVVGKALRDQDPFVQAEAAEVLGELGPAAETAVPALLDAAVQQRHVALRLSAVRALGKIGATHAAVVPAVLETLRSPELAHQFVAARALGELGPGAAPAADALSGLLDSVNEDVACAAATALGAIGAATEDVVRELIRALREGEADVPMCAASALGQIGAGREDVMAALTRALRHPNQEAREAAAAALGKLAPGAALPDVSTRRKRRER